MKQILIFAFGLLSVLIFIAGMVCGIQAIISGEPFTIVCGGVFIVVWVYMIIDWLKNNGPEMLYDHLFDR